MSAAQQRDGASKLGMGSISRFVNHKQTALPYKEGAPALALAAGCTISGCEYQCPHSTCLPGEYKVSCHIRQAVRAGFIYET